MKDLIQLPLKSEKGLPLTLQDAGSGLKRIFGNCSH